MVNSSNTRRILLILNLLAILLLGYEVWKQEIIPAVRIGGLRGEATCSQGKTHWYLQRGGPNPTDQRSPWFAVVTFALPKIQPTDDCVMVIHAPSLLHLNPRNYYIKHVLAADRTDLPNDNVGSGVLLHDDGAYTYNHGVLRIPARSLRQLVGPSRIEILVTTSLGERADFFRDAFTTYAANGRTAFRATLITMLLVVAVSILRRRRQFLYE